jgi:hypothetical protein
MSLASMLSEVRSLWSSVLGSSAERKRAPRRRTLRLESLEDRNLLSASPFGSNIDLPQIGLFGSFGTPTLSVTSTVATHFSISIPADVANDKAVYAQVTALDANNHTVPSYTGTVDLTSTDTGTGASIPATVSVTNGRALFQATFVTAGNQTITATDASTSTLTGSATTYVAAADVATHFAVLVPQNAQSGQTLWGQVEALDAQNYVVSNYSGTATFTTSDTAAKGLPASVSLTNGRAFFQVAFNTAGAETLTASSGSPATLTGSSTTQVAPLTSSHLTIHLPVGTTAGVPVSGYITAVDANNHLLTTYDGTVALTSTDNNATLPATVTFQNGFATFSATFETAGSETVTATDTTTASIVGSFTTTVAAADVATHYELIVPKNVPANVPVIVMAVALDAENHPVQNYTGTVAVTSTDKSATLPGNITFQRGQAVFEVTFATTGTESLTLTDTTTSSITTTWTGSVGTKGFGFGGFGGLGFGGFRL